MGTLIESEFSLLICWLPIADCHQNFSHQIFFALAMVTKMIPAWSAGDGKEWEKIGRDGKRWDGIRWEGMGWDEMGWDEMGGDGMGWDEMGWDEMG